MIVYSELEKAGEEIYMAYFTTEKPIGVASTWHLNYVCAK
jgi:hypothetical protein